MPFGSIVMKKEAIKKNLGSCFRAIKSLLVQMHRKPEVATIHKFRVEVKKLRAFLRLISNQSDSNSHHPLPRKLRKIYSIAGRLRDIQLQKRRIRTGAKNLEPVSGYKRMLEKLAKVQKRKLMDQLHKCRSFDFMGDLQVDIPSKLSLAGWERFVSGHVGSIQGLANHANISGSQLHLIRKQIKDVIFNFNLLRSKRELPGSLSKEQGKEVEKMARLAHKLGQYCDCTIALQFTAPIYLNTLTGIEKDSMMIMKKSWLEKRSRVRADILIMLSDWK